MSVKLMSVFSKVWQKYWSISVWTFASVILDRSIIVSKVLHMTELMAMNQEQLSWMLKMIKNLFSIVCLPQTIPEGEIGAYSPENIEFSGDCRA